MCEFCEMLQYLKRRWEEKPIEGLTPRFHAKLMETLETENGGYIRANTGYKTFDLNYCPVCGKDVG